MKHLITLLFCVLAASSFGQEKLSVSLYTSPFGSIDFYNGTNVNLGCEFGIKGTSKNFISVGYYTPTFSFAVDRIWQNLNGFYVLNEYRNYYGSGVSERTQTDFYWGIEAFYGNQSYTRSDSVTVLSVTTYKTYANERQFYGLSGNIGVTWTLLKRLQTGLNFGFGLRYNQLQNDLTEDEAKSRELGDWTVPHNWIQKKGNNIIPKFNFGVRIGYKIR